jgi:hypothetical protein
MPGAAAETGCKFLNKSSMPAAVPPPLIICFCMGEPIMLDVQFNPPLDLAMSRKMIIGVRSSLAELHWQVGHSS